MPKLELVITSRFSTRWINKTFLQGMINRLHVGKLRYPKGTESFLQDEKGALRRAKESIRHYEQTGNTEFLIDAANYCMIEFTEPLHAMAHSECSDSAGRRGGSW